MVIATIEILGIMAIKKVGDLKHVGIRNEGQLPGDADLI